jgi:hypothetical protein
MATVLDQLRDEITGKGASFVWSASLVASLGKPEEWEYTGIVTEAGPPTFAHCACGHPIRDCFHIKHPDGRQAIIGSTCIGYFQDAGRIYGQLSEALANLEARMNEAKKAAKRSADEIKVTEARTAYESRYDTLLTRFRAYRERGQMAPRDLWIAMASHYRVHRQAPEYQRACDYLKWYAKQTKALVNL